MITLGVTLLGAGGCRKRAAGLDALAAELQSAGLRVEGFSPAEGTRWSAYRCQSGRIEGLDALACEYGDPTAAQAGRRRVEAGWIGGAVTAVALDRDKLVLAVADRGRADPNGRAIARISRAFAGPPGAKK